ncbi:nucleoside-diphosphate kinase [Candidatus Roizmanbacteria bacterium]|nr:nucleoside-diphosphate kinase [Candidatus Roizmanbacteria bacterium]
MERTLLVVKPDGVSRGLVGEILRRFERAGLKIVAAKMVKVTKELAEKHYPGHREDWIKDIGHKTLENYKELEMDAKKLMGTDDPKEIGKMVRVWLLEYITSGPVFAVVLEGPHAVDLVRKISGHTLPSKAPPGTIRGDLSFDSSYLANTGKRAIKNLVHASGSKEEAEYEIPLWFSKEEILAYERAEEKYMK